MHSNQKKPDFIVIGPEKTGTSLLYRVLHENPQVSLPPYKEIRYWNEGEQIPRHNLFRVLSSKHWHYRSLRRLFRKKAISILRDVAASIFQCRRMDPILLWYLKYLVGRRSSVWYESLFTDDGRLAGDISPLYYHVSEKRIRECHTHNPNAKIIILVRDPIERTWSKARMNLLVHKARDPKDFNYEEFHLFVEYVYKNWRPYKETIESWSSVFSSVHLAFYDELLDDPRQWYGKICTFLGIQECGTHLLKKKVNKGVELNLPRVVETILFKQYGEELKDFGESYNLPRWLRRYDELSAGSL